MCRHFAVHPAHDGDAKCEPWEARVTLIRLPSIPALPCPAETPQEEFNVTLQLSNIAAGHNFVVGLTNFGHITKINVQLGEVEGLGNMMGQDVGINALNAAISDGRVAWEYLHTFSEHAKAKSAIECTDMTPPRNFKATRITARSHTFCVYSADVEPAILMGDRNMTAESSPLLKPSLQRQSIGSLVLGSSHHGLVTTDGSLLTWGRYNSGALGLGDPRKLLPGVPGGYAEERERERARKGEILEPPEVLDPSQVRFDWRAVERRKFILHAAVGQAHSAALVVDLEEEEELSKSEAFIGWLTSVRQKISGYLTVR